MPSYCKKHETPDLHCDTCFSFGMKTKVNNTFNDTGHIAIKGADYVKLQQELTDLQAFSEKARKVIEFYNNPAEWYENSPFEYDRIDRSDIINNCGGKRAREFLQSDEFKKVFGGEKE